MNPPVKSQAIFRRIIRDIWGLSASAQHSSLTMVEGKGVYVKDADGNWYIDLHSGPAIMNTGHGHPYVLSAIEKQLHTLVHCHDMVTPSRLTLNEQLKKMISGPPRKIGLLTTGSEAVELALRISREYTQRKSVIVFSGAFHGKTLGALACTDPIFRNGWWCDECNTFRLPYPECSRCFLKLKPSECKMECSKFCIKQIESLKKLPAALLFEPAQGTAGNVFPPDGFFQDILSYSYDKGILTIADEIITGCGRTGKFLATDGLITKPDILLLGKGIGSGFPISAVLPIGTIVSSPKVNTIGSTSTSYGGNPLAVAAATATLEVIEKEKLIQNSAKVGEYFYKGLIDISEQYDIVKNVRGRGLMLGFDLHHRRGKDIGKEFFKICLKNGIMIMGINTRVRINPPLIFQLEHVNEALVKLDASLKSLEVKT